MSAICAHPGCPTIVKRGRCEQHTAPDSRHPDYRTTRWTNYSRRYRADHPFCATCGRLSAVVDHIVPAWYAPDLFWDEGNHQPLCARCNRVKGASDAVRYR